MSRKEEIINRALNTKKAKVISSVYETEDYSIFKELENQRVGGVASGESAKTLVARGKNVI